MAADPSASSRAAGLMALPVALGLMSLLWVAVAAVIASAQKLMPSAAPDSAAAKPRIRAMPRLITSAA